MRWILRSLAIAVAGALLFSSAHKPAYAAGEAELVNSGNPQAIIAAMYAANQAKNSADITALANALVKSGNAALIAAVLGSRSVAGGAGGAAIANALVSGGNSTLIASVMTDASAGLAQSNVVNLIGTAVAASPNASTLGATIATAMVNSGNTPLASSFIGTVALTNTTAALGIAIATGVTPGPPEPPPPSPTPPLGQGVGNLPGGIHPPPPPTCTTSCT